MILKHIPNILTLFRLAFIAPFLFCLSKEDYVHAFYIFVLAGLTDGLDGWFARYFQCQSFFGSFVDPLADKLLVASSFLSLALIGTLPWWLVGLVFLRDITISMGVLAWYWIIKKQLEFKPTLVSKFNTTFQLTLITLCLFNLAYFEFPVYFINIFIVLTTLTTTASYLDYLWTWGNKALSRKQSAHE